MQRWACRRPRLFWRLPAINADPRQRNGPPNAKPKPRNCAPCPCLHWQARCDNESAVMWYKNATIPSKFVFLSDPLQGAEIRPHRSELRPRLCVWRIWEVTLEPRASLSAAHRPFRGPKARGIRSRPGSSEAADQGLQKKEGRYLDHHSQITSLTTHCFPLLPFPLHLSRRCYHSPRAPTLCRRSHYDKAQSAPAWRN